jgi:hypothetical protein
VRRLVVAWALFGLALVLLIPCLEAAGQGQSDLIYQYAVKVVQGKTPGLWGTPSPSDPLGEALYCTSVNVHNPWGSVAEYRFKLAVAGHFGDPGPITPFYDRKLDPDAVTQYDGEDFDFMLAAIGLPCPFCFFEGYFVIESRVELDVVAVYTGSVLENHALATMETERVPAREIAIPVPLPCQGLLDLTISTGAVQWILAGAAAQEVAGYSGWALPPAGCSWVGDSTSPWPAADVYDYEYEFCLCEGFDNVEMQFRLWADNSATVLLNNQALILAYPAGSGWWTTGCLVHVIEGDNNDHFVPGLNTLTIRVTNADGPSGMMVSGWITANPGRCP